MQKGAAFLTIVAPVLAFLYSIGLLDGLVLEASLKLDQLKAAMQPEPPEPPPRLSMAEMEVKLVADLERHEVGVRAELEANPTSARLQAKLAQSLLETNGSWFVPRPERLEEGRLLVEKALAKAPENVSTILAQVALHMAEKDVQTGPATELAEKAVKMRQKSIKANRALGQVQVIEACWNMCRVRKAMHRLKVDPPGSVYPPGKDPTQMAQPMMKAAADKFVEGAKRLQVAIDQELYDRTKGKATKDEVMEAFAPIMPMLQIEKIEGGIHPKTLFSRGGCHIFEGRKLNGVRCPFDEPDEPKKKKKGKKGKKGEKAAAAAE